MIAEFVSLLSETALASTFAMLAVLILRLPLRRLCGARSAYALWWLIPAALIAVLLPARTEVLPMPSVTLASTVTTASAAPLPAAAQFDPQPWLIAAWAAGAIGFAAVCGWRQRCFRRGLGRLRARGDGSWLAESADLGPAVIGAWRGRIVLPSDFEVRYSALERELVLRHERVHIARRDLVANLVATALRGLYWFNPLVHYAVGRFRFDQELATDAAVLAQRPDARRSYADAMLKTQLLFDPPPLGCHWQSAHPLKERIVMLKHPLPGALRYAAGCLLAFSLSLLAGLTAWASQPAQVSMSPDVTRDEVSVAWRVLNDGKVVREARGSATLGARLGDNGEDLNLRFWFEEITPTEVLIAVDLKITEANQVRTASPKLRVRRGESGSFALSDSDAPYDPKSGTPPEWSVEFDIASVSAPAAGTTAPLPTPPPGLADTAEGPLPTYRRIAPPKYPQTAVDAKHEGSVLLRVLVDSDGLPQQVEIESSSGYADLDEAATAAVRKWAFNAAHDGNKAVSMWVGVPIDFSLKDKAESAPAPSGNTLDEIYVRPKQQASQTAPALKFGWTDQGTLGWVESGEQC